MAEGIVTVAADGLPGRYAAALLDLARSQRAIDAVSADLATLARAIEQSPDLARLVSGRPADGSEAAMLAVAGALGLSPLVRRFLGVVARNRRLKSLPAMIRAFAARVDALRGIQTARVTAAHPLAEAQVEALGRQLKARTGADMRLDITVDPAILGGLVVRLGSRQIDSSVRTRLERLGQKMKG